MTSLTSKFVSAIIIIFSLAICNTYSQDVKYYKLIRKISNGVSDKSVQGGLFITFSGNSCFESNIYGVGINHGVMRRNDEYSNSQCTVFMGSSYWGRHTVFKFNSDKSALNVIFDDDEIYVYQQVSPPQGIKTCSEIRSKKPSSTLGNNTPPPTYFPPATQNSGFIGDRNNDSEATFYESVYVDVDCPHCHRSGECQSCNGTGMIDYTFGEGKLDCPNCRNGVCQYCNGKGTIKDRQTVERKM